MTQVASLDFDAAREVFVGGGEMARRMLTHDWASTPLGPPSHWPQSLKTTVRIMLTSRFAMWMAWGDGLTFLCNDAYRPTLGVKQGWALGARSDVVWAEIWKDIGPRIDHVLSAGEATWDEGLRLFLERSGYPEETYHTFSYSPLANDAGVVTGMLCVVTEESERVVGERRVRVLRDLAARLSGARTEDEVFAATRACLAQDAHDLPFAAAYLHDEDERWRRTFALEDHEAAPPTLRADVDAPWPLRAVLERGEACEVEDFRPFGTLPSGPWSSAPKRALVLPISQPGAERAAGAFIVGLNPHRPLDDGYRGFLNLFVGQVASGLANANAYEQERRRAEALAALDRAKTAFFANASHELRTPLTLMLGPIEDLLSDETLALTSRGRDTLEMAHRNSLRLLRLVNGLLDFSRLESGRARASYASVDFAALTADLASSFRAAMERAELSYVVDAPALPEPVYVDAELWEKVVLNLVSNAFKFTLTGGVQVSVRAEGRDAVLRVRDTGVGVPEAEVPRLFERFHRVEGQRGRSFEGTGIGLALVKEIVQLHGGRIDVESDVGRGTTFTVRIPFGTKHLPSERVGARRDGASTAVGALPYVEEALRWLPSARDATVPEAPASPRGEARRGRVLLADDNADLREYIRRLLEPTYDVDIAVDGEAALASVERAKPDLVITDVMMPRLDGFGLLRALREREATRDLPVIMLSARAGEEARVHGLEAGADDYLVKPFSARELLAKVGANLTLAGVRREALQREQAYSAELEARVAERTRDLQRALERSEGQTAELDAILASLPDAVYVGDLDGIKRANTPALSLLGFDDFAQLDRPVQEVDAQLDLRDAETGARIPANEGPFVKAARGETIQQDVVLRHAKSGEDRVVRVAAAPIRRGEDVLGAVSVVADITERVRLQESLRRANAELRRSNADLERFAYITSHDLIEPIRTVTSFAGLLERKYGERLDERGKDFLDLILKGSERLKALVDDLLAYSRITGDAAPFKPLALSAPLGEALTRLGRRVAETNAKITVGELPTVQGDGPQLAQLFQNLLANALKFTRPGVTPEVHVSATRDGDVWRVTVSDNGIGIEAAYLDKIFVLFQRLHTRDKFEGTGLGLGICQRIVERHGGRIWATSTPGAGSAFHFTLPTSLDAP